MKNNGLCHWQVATMAFFKRWLPSSSLSRTAKHWFWTVANDSPPSLKKFQKDSGRRSIGYWDCTLGAAWRGGWRVRSCCAKQYANHCTVPQTGNRTMKCVTLAVPQNCSTATYQYYYSALCGSTKSKSRLLSMKRDFKIIPNNCQNPTVLGLAGNRKQI